ncbi:MAG: hypothetical protein M1305_05315 [Candidatus Marsarchaeota archaeon]|jgi:hypothetical protein|nr:hypothetical protein [Candidatus Marsarchaeota archaeon]
MRLAYHLPEGRIQHVKPLVYLVYLGLYVAYRLCYFLDVIAYVFCLLSDPVALERLVQLLFYLAFLPYQILLGLQRKCLGGYPELYCLLPSFQVSYLTVMCLWRLGKLCDCGLLRELVCEPVPVPLYSIDELVYLLLLLVDLAPDLVGLRIGRRGRGSCGWRCGCCVICAVLDDLVAQLIAHSDKTLL